MTTAREDAAWQSQLRELGIAKAMAAFKAAGTESHVKVAGRTYWIRQEEHPGELLRFAHEENVGVVRVLQWRDRQGWRDVTHELFWQERIASWAAFEALGNPDPEVRRAANAAAEAARAALDPRPWGRLEWIITGAWIAAGVGLVMALRLIGA
jgi:hypothetical protein